MVASSNPFQRGSRGGGCSSMETMLLDGNTAHHGGDVCVMCVSLAKSLPSRSFHSRRNALRCFAVLRLALSKIRKLCTFPKFSQVFVMHIKNCLARHKTLRRYYTS